MDMKPTSPFLTKEGPAEIVYQQRRPSSDNCQRNGESSNGGANHSQQFNRMNRNSASTVSPIPSPTNRRLEAPTDDPSARDLFANATIEYVKSTKSLETNTTDFTSSTGSGSSSSWGSNNDFSLLEVRQKPRKYPSLEDIANVLEPPIRYPTIPSSLVCPIDEDEECPDMFDQEQSSNLPPTMDGHARFEQQLAVKLVAQSPLTILPRRPAAHVPPHLPWTTVSCTGYLLDAIVTEEPSVLTEDCEIGSHSPGRRDAAVNTTDEPIAALEEGENDENQVEEKEDENFELYLKAFLFLLVVLCILAVLVLVVLFV